MNWWEEASLHVQPTFDAGTTLHLYANYIADSGSPRPIGPSLGSEVVDQDGNVTFTDLVEGESYICGAVLGDRFRFIRFAIPSRDADQVRLDEVSTTAGEALEVATETQEGLASKTLLSLADVDADDVGALDLLAFDGADFIPAVKAQLNEVGVPSPFDTALYVRTAKKALTSATQGIYIQHGVEGNLGAHVNDASASELRLTGASNGGAGQNAFEASLVVPGGITALASVNGITANFHTEGAPTGTIEKLALIRSQPVETLAAGLVITNLYGLFVGSQTKGANNFSLWIDGGTSVIRGTVKPAVKAESGLVIRGLEGQEGGLLVIQTSALATVFEVSALGSVRIGQGLATAATDGFLYIPTSNGAPTGVPTAKTGTVALEYDRANNNLYVYNGAWKKVGMA